ncbi:flavodoxin domain-containing protein [Flavimaricola marinus]|uniref:Protoporphyrinogen IX dehydrogenase [menaquinone] n=1 Tax=Flavimaricola marinus TaxID=1819565 RepID=A0A238LJ21_9RHOB|nr:flavodoxin domain-containing protein [Flavimaricola marinus]SMY08956.1 Protoporphyrinogen IX dehydrogenase [menaquinone] [Flavimaricola marinus]
MNVLLIFETVEGQSRKIVKFLRDRAETSGHTVQVFDTADKLGTLSFAGIDRVVLVAPVHERRHPRTFEVVVASNLEDLNHRPSLMVSVSLKAAFPESIDEAKDYLVEMEMRTGFVPDREMLAAGAVRTASYGYFESQIVQNVALEGRQVDLVNGVREFTDWQELGAQFDSFLETAERQSS